MQVAPGLTVTSDPSVTGRLRIGHNTLNNASSPLHVVRHTRMLEQLYPNVEVEWRDIFTSTQTRDTLLAREIDMTYSTTPVFVQGWSRGVPYKILTPLSRFDGWLMVRPDGPADITGFVGSGMKISPGPGTTPYYAAKALLSRAGADIDALEQSWVVLEPAQSAQLLATGSPQELGGQWDTDRWSVLNRDAGMRRIASFSDAFGMPVATVAITLTDWAETNPALATAVAGALRTAITWMRDNPGPAAEQLAAFTRAAGNDDAEPAHYVELFEAGLLEPITADAGIAELERLFQGLDLVEGDGTPAGPADYYTFPEHAGTRW
ncbi:hypothetical protein BJF78_17520 [Pseudonocardia sp. CNS-139]|nr:hypothetical protein BJF78_17520 [Pseudonocardia sp. CNS-139]